MILSAILSFHIFIVPGWFNADVFTVTLCFWVNVIIRENPSSFEKVVEHGAHILHIAKGAVGIGQVSGYHLAAQHNISEGRQHHTLGIYIAVGGIEAIVLRTIQAAVKDGVISIMIGDKLDSCIFIPHFLYILYHKNFFVSNKDRPSKRGGRLISDQIDKTSKDFGGDAQRSKYDSPCGCTHINRDTNNRDADKHIIPP